MLHNSIYNFLKSNFSKISILIYSRVLIWVDSKITAELGPGKAYIKGYEYESVATEFVDVNKARDTRAVVEEKQGLSFGPVLRITDYFFNNS